MVARTNGERALAFQQLRESEERHRATLSNVSDAVFLTDDNGTSTFICPDVDVIFGYAPDEVRAFDRIDALLGASLLATHELAAGAEIRNIEHEVIRKSGQHRSLSIGCFSIGLAQGATTVPSIGRKRSFTLQTRLVTLPRSRTQSRKH